MIDLLCGRSACFKFHFIQLSVEVSPRIQQVFLICQQLSNLLLRVFEALLQVSVCLRHIIILLDYVLLPTPGHLQLLGQLIRPHLIAQNLQLQVRSHSLIVLS